MKTAVTLARQALRAKRLRIVSRGKRRGQVDVLSPAASGGKGFELAPAERAWALGDVGTPAGEEHLPWIVGLETWRAARKLRPLGVAGWMTEFSARNPLQGRSLRVTQAVGKRLAYAATLWNQLGSKWPDLWDYYAFYDCADGEERQEAFLRYFGDFLDFLATLQGEEPPEIAESFLAHVDRRVCRPSRGFLQPGSPAVEVLAAAGVSEQNLEALRGQVARWKQGLHLWEQQWTPDSEAETAATLLGGVARYYGLQIERDDRVPGGGVFEVPTVCVDDGLSFRPRARLRGGGAAGDAFPPLPLAHEIGHFFRHGDWLAELGLADHAIGRLTGDDLGTAVGLLELRNRLQRKLVLNHSAVEIAADEFAFESLIGDDRIAGWLETFDVTRNHGWTYLAGFVDATLKQLGAVTECRRRRFHQIFVDRAPEEVRTVQAVAREAFGGDGTVPVAAGNALRQVCHTVSVTRVGELLDDYWLAVQSHLGRPSGGRPSRRRRSQRSPPTGSGFYFDGIVCDAG